MQIKLPNGIVLDDQALWAPKLAEYAVRKNIQNIRAFVSTDTTGVKNYLLVQGEQPIFENQSFEACAVHLDMMAASKRFDKLEL